MLEHSIYSVISPEGCASILWRGGGRDESRIAEAANALKLTAADLFRLGVADRLIYEPVGGAHRDHATALARVGAALAEELDPLMGLDADTLRQGRRQRFRALSSL
jgi:acetyl-CoA carboxylase carboxyl transferase subunit alpha